MREIVFDSSFLIAITERPTTWYEDIVEKVGGFEPVILECVLEELRRISIKGGKKARYASLAAGLAASFSHHPALGGRVDDEIVEYARKKRAIVATIDEDLTKRLKEIGVRVISLGGRRIRLL